MEDLLWQPAAVQLFFQKALFCKCCGLIVLFLILQNDQRQETGACDAIYGLFFQ